MEDFYSGFERAKSAREEASVTSKPESLTPHGDISGNENDDLFHGDELDFDDFVMEEDNPNRDLGDLWTSDDSIDAVLESMDLHPASCPTTTAPDDSIAPMLGIFRDCGLLNLLRKIFWRVISSNAVCLTRYQLIL
ncbi:hypothetical protein L915_15558 [Phytophthora nicotianae]|uniref:Uncharacterized protein n=1 Tax=Phytophthora nicotianae TaxID=4792 RepID=W2G631_PHYNI|nr:hypothetical protein L915_15558 [Phytophthora nicotianae]